MTPQELPANLPGLDLVLKGCADLQSQQLTSETLLVITPPSLPTLHDDAEFLFYRMIEKEDPTNAHAAYNALIQRIISFQNAFSHLPKVA